MSILDKQEGGSHYKDMAIQPIEFIVANGLEYRVANVIKYACRHASKNGAEDIKKAIHYLEMILETDYSDQTKTPIDQEEWGEWILLSDSRQRPYKAGQIKHVDGAISHVDSIIEGLQLLWPTPPTHYRVKKNA